MLGAQGLCAGRDLYGATPTVTRDLGLYGLILRVIYFRIDILKEKGHTIHDCGFFVNKVNKAPRTQLIENSSTHDYWVY
jgi:hypothetical protein